MGVVDKLKKILFDEEDVEVPVNTGELPEKELRIVADNLEKKVASSKTSTKKEEAPTRSFKDYHEYDDEDTIVELKVPAYDEEEEEEQPKIPEKRIKFPIDDFDDFDDDDEDDYVPTRIERVEEPKKSAPRSESSRIPKYVSDLRNEQHKEPREEKDYRKIIHELDDENKKPFEVTPIISPVFGVLNKNYKQEEVDEKKALITQVNSGAKSRMYGPVSYNDAPLPRPPKFEPKKNGLKEELVELNSTISDLISDKVIDESDIEMPAKIVPDPVEEIDIPKIADTEDDDDLVIATENYDEIPASIEMPSKGHTSIEDAFESTSEFDEITDYDREVEKRSIEEEVDDEIIEEEEYIPPYQGDEEDLEEVEEIVEEEEIIDEEEDEVEEEVEEKKTTRKRPKPVEIEEILEKEEAEDDDRLTDTIETDLFNLIDSMYKDEEEDEDSEDE